MITRSICVETSLEDIQSKCPAGKIPMFRVKSISSKIEDHMCGEHVYVKNNYVYDFMSEEQAGHVKEFGLHFVSYIAP